MPPRLVCFFCIGGVSDYVEGIGADGIRIELFAGEFVVRVGGIVRVSVVGEATAGVDG